MDFQVLNLQAPSKLQQNLNIFISIVEHLMCPVSTSAGYQVEHFLLSRDR